jgi:hypothetical protein
MSGEEMERVTTNGGPCRLDVWEGCILNLVSIKRSRLELT